MKTVFKMIPFLFTMVIISCGNKTKTNDATGDAKSNVNNEQKAPADKKLPFERGSYVEETNMMGMELKKTVYFDHWGDWKATENKSEIAMMGYTHKTDNLEIVKGDMHWNLDLIKRTGTSFVLNVPTGGMAAALAAAVGGKMAEGMEIKEMGEENYLGYKCKKTQVKYAQMQMDVTTLSYGNLTMKMEGTMGKSNISTKIVSIDLSAPDASIFEVPTDIKIEKQ